MTIGFRVVVGDYPYGNVLVTNETAQPAEYQSDTCAYTQTCWHESYSESCNILFLPLYTINILLKSTISYSLYYLFRVTDFLLFHVPLGKVKDLVEFIFRHIVSNNTGHP